MEGLLEKVSERLGDAVLDRHDHRGDATVQVDPVHIRECLRTLRDDEELRFCFLMDLTAVDYLGREPRFEVVYHLASIETEPRGTEPSALRARLRVKAAVAEEPGVLDSVVELWPAANWMEREVFDLYGVRFQGHPDLRRILLYDKFEGHPLRKDYPKERRQPLIGPRN
ncbi:MAG: NADH-quinone oxidoreductase subunit C [Myxococcota bacterium]